jgi:glyoxylase-like metal-dependent hydrolase (beta-lactamase superfamily II)
MLENGYGGGNVAVLVGGDGLVLVDADEAPRHQLLLAALKQLSDKPVRYVIDTHCHGDHTWGNAAFQREGATVVAHRNVRERLATNSHCGPRPGTGLPTVTFDSELTLYVDDEEIRIIKLPAGHTDGDSMIYFKKANVVEAGDAFTTNQLPGASKQQGGTMVGITDELKTILEVVPEDAKVIPGHGAQASISDVRHALQTLEGMKNAIQRQIRAGKTLEEIREMKVLSPWSASIGPLCSPHTPCDHSDSNFFLNAFYRDLTTVQTAPNAGPNQTSGP